MDRLLTHKSGGTLWQGDLNDVKALLQRPHPQISVIGLFAQEYQPDDPTGRYELMKLGYDDNARAQDVELSQVANLADGAADDISDRIRAGKHVLSSCAMGLNRSGLVSALVLMKLASLEPDAAINHVRTYRRHPDGWQALYNPRFVEIVHDLAGTRGSKAAFTEWFSAHR